MDDKKAKEWPRLLPELEPWLNRSFHELPNELRKRLAEAGFTPPSATSAERFWEQLAEERRRPRAAWCDFLNDPVSRPTQQQIADIQQQRRDISDEIEEWEQAGAPTVSEVQLRKSNLQGLRRRRAELEVQTQAHRGDHVTTLSVPRARDATGNVIEDVIQEIGTTDPARIWARLTDGRVVGTVSIGITKDKNGSPAAFIAGKTLTRDSLRKRLARRPQKPTD